MTFIPISNRSRYTATVNVDNNPIYFKFRWNTRTKSYFILATNTLTNEILISNKSINSDGYLELNRNSKSLIGFMQLIPLSEHGTSSLGNWANTHTLVLSTAEI